MRRIATVALLVGTGMRAAPVSGVAERAEEIGHTVRCRKAAATVAAVAAIAGSMLGRELGLPCVLEVQREVLGIGVLRVKEDPRERCHDGGIGPLSRKSVGCPASHPAAPRKPDDNRRDGADSYSL